VRLRQFWDGFVTVTPARDFDGDVREVRAGHSREAREGVRRLLSHDDAMDIVHTIVLAADRRLSVTVAVPRETGDHDADVRRAAALINRAFWGDEAAS
jgi:hypothetical protein